MIHFDATCHVNTTSIVLEILTEDIHVHLTLTHIHTREIIILPSLMRLKLGGIQTHPRCPRYLESCWMGKSSVHGKPLNSRLWRVLGCALNVI